MGLIAKQQTKKRVAPVSRPVNVALVGTPWLTTGAIPTGALNRSSVFALNLGGVQSYETILSFGTISELRAETDDFK